jgi:tetratricopeptide (TPR) repeat protein
MTAALPDRHASLLEEARALRASRRWPELARLVDGVSDDVRLAAPELSFLGALALRITGRAARARALAGDAEREAARRGDRRLAAEASNLVGVVAFQAGEVDEAERRWGELLDAATAWGDEVLAAQANNNLGVVAAVRGRRDQALLHYQRALAANRRMGEARGVAEAHHNLGLAYRDLGFDAEADAHFRHAAGHAEAAGVEDVAAMAETERALLRARAGDGALAERMVERAIERFRRLGEARGVAEGVRVRAAAARADRRDDDAARWLEEALAAARDLDDSLLLAEVLRDRGLLLRDRGAGGEARAALEESAAHFDRIGAAAEAEAVRAIARESAQSADPA